MTPVEDPAIVFASAQLILLYLGRLQLPSQRPDMLYWRKIWRPGRPWTTKDDRVSQEIAPHTVTPCEIAVCRSTINAGSDRWPVRLQTRAVVISTETESGFITEDDTSPVCHTRCLEVGKIQSTLPMMWVSGKRLSGRRLSANFGQSSPYGFSLDGTGCLEGGVALNRCASDVVGAEVATLLIARSSRSFVFLGRPDPPRRYTLPSVIHCCQHRATTISSDRGSGRYVYSTATWA
ncbi:hypothetical protein TNCV_3889971 [Trichonephila clavipes]|nr:hypothetical protein TNCV_3889971 [Trichonephila clavipes]